MDETMKFQMQGELDLSNPIVKVMHSAIFRKCDQLGMSKSRILLALVQKLKNKYDSVQDEDLEAITMIRTFLSEWEYATTRQEVYMALLRACAKRDL